MTYDVIYADPPWQYRNVRTGGSHTSGSAQKYPTLSTHQLRRLPVASIAAKNAVLALWATTPMGLEPFLVMHAWGFTYKTKLYWHKRIFVPGMLSTGETLGAKAARLLPGFEEGRVPTKLGRKGTGYWLRGETEELLIGIRGTVPAWRANFDNWLETWGALEQLPGEHSEKPVEVVRLLEQLTPEARRVELFATTASAVLANRHEGVGAMGGVRLGVHAPDDDVETPPDRWDCYGLDLGDDFREPQFWTDLQART